MEEKKKVLTSSSQENERYVIQISELESQINDLKMKKKAEVFHKENKEEQGEQRG